MFSKLTTTLALSLGLLSTASAAAIANAQQVSSTQQSSNENAWYISSYRAGCANGKCHYSFQLDSYGALGEAAFTAQCSAANIPRADKKLRDCSITYGNNDGVQNVQVYMELTPLRPNYSSELFVQVGYADTYSDSVTFYSASQYGNYQSWRTYSTSQYGGQFQLYPAYSAAIA